MLDLNILSKTVKDCEQTASEMFKQNQQNYSGWFEAPRTVCNLCYFCNELVKELKTYRTIDKLGGK